MPALAVNGFSETKDVARFNGGFKWSLREAPRLERYFTQTFGRRLPVTASGQSETHNRLALIIAIPWTWRSIPTVPKAKGSWIICVDRAFRLLPFAVRAGRFYRSAHPRRQTFGTTPSRLNSNSASTSFHGFRSTRLVCNVILPCKLP